MDQARKPSIKEGRALSGGGGPCRPWDADKGGEDRDGGGAINTKVLGSDVENCQGESHPDKHEFEKCKALEDSILRREADMEKDFQLINSLREELAQRSRNVDSEHEKLKVKDDQLSAREGKCVAIEANNTALATRLAMYKDRVDALVEENAEKNKVINVLEQSREERAIINLNEEGIMNALKNKVEFLAAENSQSKDLVARLEAGAMDLNGRVDNLVDENKKKSLELVNAVQRADSIELATRSIYEKELGKLKSEFTAREAESKLVTAALEDQRAGLAEQVGRLQHLTRTEDERLETAIAKENDTLRDEVAGLRNAVRRLEQASHIYGPQLLEWEEKFRVSEQSLEQEKNLGNQLRQQLAALEEQRGHESAKERKTREEATQQVEISHRRIEEQSKMMEGERAAHAATVAELRKQLGATRKTHTDLQEYHALSLARLEQELLEKEGATSRLAMEHDSRLRAEERIEALLTEIGNNQARVVTEDQNTKSLLREREEYIETLQRERDAAAFSNQQLGAELSRTRSAGEEMGKDNIKLKEEIAQLSTACSQKGIINEELTKALSAAEAAERTATSRLQQQEETIEKLRADLVEMTMLKKCNEEVNERCSNLTSIFKGKEEELRQEAAKALSALAEEFNQAQTEVLKRCDHHKSEGVKLTTQLDQMEKKNRELTAQLSSMSEERGEIEELTRENRKLSSEVGALREKVEELHTQYTGSMEAVSNAHEYKLRSKEDMIEQLTHRLETLRGNPQPRDADEPGLENSNVEISPLPDSTNQPMEAVQSGGKRGRDEQVQGEDGGPSNIVGGGRSDTGLGESLDMEKEPGAKRGKVGGIMRRTSTSIKSTRSTKPATGKYDGGATISGHATTPATLNAAPSAGSSPDPATVPSTVSAPATAGAGIVSTMHDIVLRGNSDASSRSKSSALPVAPSPSHQMLTVSTPIAAPTFPDNKAIRERAAPNNNADANVDRRDDAPPIFGAVAETERLPPHRNPRTYTLPIARPQTLIATIKPRPKTEVGGAIRRNRPTNYTLVAPPHTPRDSLETMVDTWDARAKSPGERELERVPWEGVQMQRQYEQPQVIRRSSPQHTHEHETSPRHHKSGQVVEYFQNVYPMYSEQPIPNTETFRAVGGAIDSDDDMADKHPDYSPHPALYSSGLGSPIERHYQSPPPTALIGYPYHSSSHTAGPGSPQNRQWSSSPPPSVIHYGYAPQTFTLGPGSQ